MPTYTPEAQKELHTNNDHLSDKNCVLYNAPGRHLICKQVIKTGVI